MFLLDALQQVRLSLFCHPLLLTAHDHQPVAHDAQTHISQGTGHDTISTALTTRPCTPLTVTCDGGKLIFSYILDRDGLVVRAYDPHTNTWTTLWKLDAAVDSAIGVCSLHLDLFVSAKA
jgi:hypothetical protein